MEGFAQQALQSYGPYAAYVLKKWKMNTFKDLGTILLHLSEFEMVQLKDTEQFDHFNNDINLEKLLLKPFLIEAKKLKFSAPEFDCLRKNM